MKLHGSFRHVTKIICTKNNASQSNKLKVINDLVINEWKEREKEGGGGGGGEVGQREGKVKWTMGHF